MEIQSGNVVEEAIPKKEASVLGLMEKLSETDAALRQLLSCQPAVQVSPVDLEGVGNHHERFKLLVGLEFLLQECLREVQSIVSEARGEELKKRIAAELEKARETLARHQKVLRNSEEHEPYPNDPKYNHRLDQWTLKRRSSKGGRDEETYKAARDQWMLKHEEREGMVRKAEENVRALEEELETLKRGEHLSDGERASLVSAYDEVIAETRRRMELLLKGAESNDAVMQGARRAAEDAVSDVRKRSERLLRLDQSSPPAAPKEHQKGSRGQRAAHGRRGGTRPIGVDTQGVFAGRRNAESAGDWSVDVRSSLPDGAIAVPMTTTVIVDMGIPLHCVSQLPIARKATKADAERALEEAGGLTGRCCDDLDEEFKRQSQMLSKQEDTSMDGTDECLRERFSPNKERAYREAVRLRRDPFLKNLKREAVIVSLCKAAITVARDVMDGAATMTMGNRVELTIMASSLLMQAELVEEFGLSPCAEIIAGIRNAIREEGVSESVVTQAVMEAVMPCSGNGESSRQAEAETETCSIPPSIAAPLRELMGALEEQGCVGRPTIVAAEVLLALGVQSNTICIHSAIPPSS